MPENPDAETRVGWGDQNNVVRQSTATDKLSQAGELIRLKSETKNTVFLGKLPNSETDCDLGRVPGVTHFVC